MFKFTKDSGCVKVWARLITDGKYTIDQCPALYNLKECVEELLKEEKAKEKNRQTANKRQ